MDLLGLLRSSLRETRVHLPLAPGGYLRGSGLAGLCPREEVLAAREGVTRQKVEGADALITYAHGHGLHFALQNHVLPAVGVLYGRWLCVDCGVFYGTPRESFPLRVEDHVVPPVLEGVLVPRPERCTACGGRDFLYRELSFAAPEYGTGGHPDGYIRLEGRPGLGVLEAKSIAQAWEVRSAPHVAHAVQLQTYLWFTGFQWGVVLYWHKSGQGQASFVAHYLDRDEETIARIKSSLREVWDGLEGGPLPDRICHTEKAPRAEECALRKLCFTMAAEAPVLPSDEGFEAAAEGFVP